MTKEKFSSHNKNCHRGIANLPTTHNALHR